MNAFYQIASIIQNLRLWCFDNAVAVKDWILVGGLLSGWLFSIHDFLRDMQLWFINAGQWYDSVQTSIKTILSWEIIYGFIKSWLPKIEELHRWFLDWSTYVWSLIATFWEAALVTVNDLIDAATKGLATLQVAWDTFLKVTFPEWTAGLATLQAKWDNFWTVTYPTLVDVKWAWDWWKGRFTEVNELINTKIKEVEPLWAGWEEVRENIFAFVNDPLEFLWDRFTDWFLGPEE